MTRNWISKAALSAVIGGCAVLASAQGLGNIGLSARIGYFQSTDSNHSGSFFAVGADYKLTALPASIPASGLVGYWGISADYYDRGAVSNLPVVLNYNLRQGPLTYSLGAGIEFYDLKDYGGSSGTGFNGQAGIAYEIKTPVIPFFLQAKYFLASHSELSGLGLYAGVRF